MASVNTTNHHQRNQAKALTGTRTSIAVPTTTRIFATTARSSSPHTVCQLLTTNQLHQTTTTQPTTTNATKQRLSPALEHPSPSQLLQEYLQPPQEAQAKIVSNL